MAQEAMLASVSRGVPFSPNLSCSSCFAAALRIVPSDDFSVYFEGFYRRVRQIGIEKIDIIHEHFSSPAGTLARRLAQDLHIPYIITEHAGNFDHLLKIGIDVDRVICDADMILCVSSFLAKKIRSRIAIERDNMQVIRDISTLVVE